MFFISMFNFTPYALQRNVIEYNRRNTMLHIIDTLRKRPNHILEWCKDDERDIIVKKILSPQKDASQALAHEALILKTLSVHSGFPKLINASKSSYQREYFPGKELSLFCGKVDFDTLLEFAAQMAHLISFAHQSRIILGDIKPQNFIVAKDQKLAFFDFSLSQFFAEANRFVGGSPYYMAPELFYGGCPSPQTDLYGLGATLYELTCGRVPLKGDGIDELAKAHWVDEPRNPTANTGFPKEWGCLILRLLNKKPSDRFLDTNDLISAINRYFNKDFSREHGKVSMRDFIRGKKEWVDSEKHARAMIKNILKKKSRSEKESELATHLLYDLGHYSEMDKILSSLPDKLRLRYGAMRDLKCGHFKEARKKASELLKMGDIRSHNILGTCAYYSKDLKGAEQHYQELLSHYQKEKLYSDMIPVLNNLANIETNKKNFGMARTHYVRSQILAEVTGDLKQEAVAYASEGYLNHVLNKWGLAVQSYNKAAHIYDGLGLNSLKMYNTINLAMIMMIVGFNDEALGFIEELEKGGEVENSDYLNGYCHLLRGDFKRRIGKYKEAVECLNKAVSIFDKSKDLSDKEIATVSLIRALIEAGLNYEEFKSQLNEDNKHKIAFFEDLYLVQTSSKKGSSIKRLEALAGSDKFSLDGEEKLILFSSLSRYFREVDEEKKAQKYKRLFLDLRKEICGGFDDVLREKLNQTYPIWQEKDEKTQFAEILSWLSTRLNANVDIMILLRDTLDKLIAYTQSDRGFILLKEEDYVNRITVARNPNREDLKNEERQISWTIPNKVIDTGEPVITLDAPGDKRFRFIESIHQLKLRTIICLPFIYRGEVLGTIYLDSRAKLSPAKVDLAGVLSPFAAQMAVAIWNSRFSEEFVEDIEKSMKKLKELKNFVKGHEGDIVFKSIPMQKIMEQVQRVARSSIPVLVSGESGVGKEKIARLIHSTSTRNRGRFISISCAAIPENLLESELFGYKKGAFTGADSDKRGLFEAACGGTLFLDEIGDMPLFMQIKLLRVLQENEFMPVGSDRLIKTDIRLITATNRDLKEGIKKENFREDLYYRLNVAEIHVPPLRDRVEDIPLLIKTFIKRFCEKEKIEPKRLSQMAMNKLMSHPWPGNIRELENFVYKLVVFSKEEVIKDVAFEGGEGEGISEESFNENVSDEGLSLSGAKKEFEKKRIIHALKKFKGNVSRASEYLKVARPRLSLLIKAHQINRLDFLNPISEHSKHEKKG